MTSDLLFLKYFMILQWIYQENKSDFFMHSITVILSTSSVLFNLKFQNGNFEMLTNYIIVLQLLVRKYTDNLSENEEIIMATKLDPRYKLILSKNFN